MSDEQDVVASIAVQIGPLRRTNGQPWEEDLQTIAEQLTGYFSQNIERFADQRGGDTFVAVGVSRGEERAGHEYRSGHYVKKDEPS